MYHITNGYYLLYARQVKRRLKLFFIYLVTSKCPFGHHFPLADGLLCCSSSLRSSFCPTGPEGSYLNRDDPDQCCQGGSVACGGWTCSEFKAGVYCIQYVSRDIQFYALLDLIVLFAFHSLGTDHTEL